jgi:hypothetical protein
MKITRRYNPRTINFHLLPDKMEMVKSSAEDEHERSGRGMPLMLGVSFSLNTISETAQTSDSEEFREIVRNLTSPILALDAQVSFRGTLVYRYGEPPPPQHIFELTYQQDSIEISLAGNTAENIRKLFSDIEEVFSLEIVKPKALEEQEHSRKRTAFLAHSFNQTGKSYAYELSKFLRLIGFEVLTGEGYSPESISKKVKRRLACQEVVIIIASEAEDATWIIQETAGATFTNKPVIMLVENGVQLKAGILGDHEYIEFQEGNISTTFMPLIEGLQELGYGFMSGA